MELLLRKSGSRASLKEFRRAIRELVDEDPLPDYNVSLDKENDMLCFQSRYTVPGSPKAPWDGRLSTEAYEEAKKAAPGWDVYHLETQWRAWLSENEIEPTFPDRHFAKFCRTWYERRGPAR